MQHNGVAPDPDRSSRGGVSLGTEVNVSELSHMTGRVCRVQCLSLLAPIAPVFVKDQDVPREVAGLRILAHRVVG
jgi:hypothetical protein